MSIYKDLLEFKKYKTRQLIFKIINDEQSGIKAETIRQMLAEEYEKQISPQAVWNHLQKLKSQGLIQHRQNPTDTISHPYYVPSQTGIWQLKAVYENLYEQSKNRRIFDSKLKFTSVDFPSYMGEERSLANFETKLIEFEMEIRKCVASCGPNWWFLKGYTDRVLEMMTMVTSSNHEVTGICFNDTPVARSQASRAKGDLRINLSISSHSLFDSIYYYVFGPIVMMGFYPDNVNRKVDGIFRSYHTLDEVPKGEFEEILESKNTVKFSYAINEELAFLMRQQMKRMLNSAIYPHL